MDPSSTEKTVPETQVDVNLPGFQIEYELVTTIHLLSLPLGGMDCIALYLFQHMFRMYEEGILHLQCTY